VSALHALLPEEGATFLEVADRFMAEQIASEVLRWDAGLVEPADQGLELLEALGLTELLAYEELGAPRERLAVLLAAGRELGRVDAGMAMAALTTALTEQALGTRAGFGVEVRRPQGRAVVALVAGQERIVLVAEDGGASLVPVGQGGAPLLGLRLGGGRLLDPLVEAGTVISGSIAGRLGDQLSIAAVAAAVGAAEGSIRVAADYAGVRYQGGALISRHHAVQELLRGMRRRVAHAEILLVHLLGGDDDELRAHHLCSALAACDEAVTDGVQVLGGYGYMREYGQEKRMRDVKTLRLLFGPAG